MATNRVAMGGKARNDECQMTKESLMSNDETCQSRLFGHSGFGIDFPFVICHLEAGYPWPKKLNADILEA
jgi:hypothetical protein